MSSSVFFGTPFFLSLATSASVFGGANRLVEREELVDGTQRSGAGGEEPG